MKCPRAECGKEFEFDKYQSVEVDADLHILENGIVMFRNIRSVRPLVLWCKHCNGIVYHHLNLLWGEETKRDEILRNEETEKSLRRIVRNGINSDLLSKLSEIIKEVKKDEG
jgi:hypothetical protein